MDGRVKLCDGRRWLLARRLVAGMAALVLLASCGGSQVTLTEGDEGPREQTFELDLDAAPAVIILGPEGGRLAIDPGAFVEVPQGAFETRTQLTAVSVSVVDEADSEYVRAFGVMAERSDGNGEVGALDPPVTLVLPALESGQVAARLGLGGEWALLEGSPDTPLRVEIDHFSAELVARVSCDSLGSSGYRGGSLEALWGFQWICEQMVGATQPPEPPAVTLCTALAARQDLNYEAAIAFLSMCDELVLETLSTEDQAWINYAGDDIAAEVTRLGGGNVERIEVRGEFRTCLSEQLLDASGREGALDVCEARVADSHPDIFPGVDESGETPPEPDDRVAPDGLYSGQIIPGPDHDTSAYLLYEVTSSTAEVAVVGVNVNGEAILEWTSTRECSNTADCNTTSYATVTTFTFRGTVDEQGHISGSGTTATEYTIVGCDSDLEGYCENVYAAPPGEPLPHEVAGTVSGGALTVDIVSSGDRVFSIISATRVIGP